MEMVGTGGGASAMVKLACAEPPPAFVELSSIPAIPVSPGSEWTVELEEMSGRKLRVACKGSSTAQVIEVAQSLWRVPS